MKYRLFIPIALILLAAISLMNCSKNKETQFVVRVDSIVAPDTVDYNVAFDILFYGTIGNDGCHSYSHMDIFYESNTLSLKVWGKNSGADECPNVTVLLDGLKLTINNIEAGDNSIEVTQPDDSKLTKDLYVRQ